MKELLQLAREIGVVLASINWLDLSKVGALSLLVEKARASVPKAHKKTMDPALVYVAGLIESFIMGEYKQPGLPVEEARDQAISCIEAAATFFQDMVGEIDLTKSYSGISVDEFKKNAQGTAQKGVAASIRPDQEKEIRDYTQNSMGALDDLEQKILLLEKNGHDKNLINETFRIIHTLKGETGFAGLTGISELLHHFESVFAVLRDNPGRISSGLEDAFLNIVDILKKTFQLCTANPSLGACQTFSENCASLEQIKEQLMAPVEAVKPAPAEVKRTVERLVMAEISDISIYTDFIHEAQEHLEQIEVKVLELETDPANTVILNDIFRPLHTIKGVSGFLALKHINHIAHDSETFLDLARNGKILMDREGIDLVFEVVDVMRTLISLVDLQIKGKDFSDDQYPFVEALAGKISGLTMEKQGKDRVEGEAKVEKEKKIGEILLEQNLVSQNDLNKALETQKGEEPSRKIGEILIDQEKITARAMSEALRKQMDTGVKTDAGSVKVNTEKLDNLIDIVGELVISQTLIAQNKFILSNREPVLSKNVSHLSKIVRDIQYVSMALRMVPVKGTFQKMARLVRDLAAKSGKRVELLISGAETELDKNVVEQINDPLVHMIRNSVDHGIETPEDRKKTGKSETGKVFLNAYHQGGNIVIEVKDDGRGLDRDAIRKKAVEKGMIQPNATLEEGELFNLIFAPGFSTAKVVTDVSGRGVGMDVVRKNIEKLGGTVAITSQQGKGSMFVIRLPLTMAILDGMILQVGAERYLMPVIAIKESIQPAQAEIATVKGKGEVMSVRGQLIPLLRLHELFQVEPKVKNPWEAIVIVVEYSGKSYGILVDEILGQQQVVIKSLKGEFKNIKGISGCSIMGDGRVGLILDVKGLVEMNMELVEK